MRIFLAPAATDGWLSRAIAAAHERARTRRPGIDVDLATFSAEIHRRLGDDLDVARLAESYTDDIYIAIACLAGDRTAIEYLEREFFSEIDSAARRVRATDDQANEVRGQFRQLRFTGSRIAPRRSPTTAARALSAATCASSRRAS